MAHVMPPYYLQGILRHGIVFTYQKLLPPLPPGRLCGGLNSGLDHDLAIRPAVPRREGYIAVQEPPRMPVIHRIIIVRV